MIDIFFLTFKSFQEMNVHDFASGLTTLYKNVKKLRRMCSEWNCIVFNYLSKHRAFPSFPQKFDLGTFSQTDKVDL